MTAARQRLIEDHVDYARRLARKVRREAGLPGHVAQEELEGFALLGLTQAAHRFDPERGVPFTSFAYRRIVGEVYNGLGRMHDLPRVSRREAALRARLIAALPGRDASEPTDAAERAEALVDTVRQLVAAAGRRPRPRFARAEDAASSEPDPSERAERREVDERVRGAVGRLPAELRDVVEAYLLGDRTMAEAGETLGISAPTVHRRHKAALVALRASLCAAV